MGLCAPPNKEVKVTCIVPDKRKNVCPQFWFADRRGQAARKSVPLKPMKVKDNRCLAKLRRAIRLRDKCGISQEGLRMTGREAGTCLVETPPGLLECCLSDEWFC